MPKYLLQVSYTPPEGVRGLLKDGGTKRREVARTVVESVGGTLEAFYFAFGDTDALVIADIPDNASAAAAALSVSASGTVVTKTTVLLTPEDLDAASKKTVTYTAPGT